jgi:hypothetical protein
LFKTQLSIEGKFKYSIKQRKAAKFWQPFCFIEYRKDTKSGEEYVLVENWGEDLELQDYFELLDEKNYPSKDQASGKNTAQILE